MLDNVTTRIKVVIRVEKNFNRSFQQFFNSVSWTPHSKYNSSKFCYLFQLLLFAVAALCEAGRLTRGIDHISHFSNNQAIYHGHGATSYQNVQIDNHDDIVVPSNYGDLAEIQDLEHHESIIPVVDSHYDVHHADISDDSGKSYIKHTIAINLIM